METTADAHDEEGRLRYLLHAEQQKRLDQWRPGWKVIRDHSRGIQRVHVFEVASALAEREVLKFSPLPSQDGGEGMHRQEREHLAREIRAGQRYLPDFIGASVAAMLESDADLSMALIEHLPGEIAEGTAHAAEPEVWKAAGAALSAFSRPLRTDSSFDAGQLSSLRRRLSGQTSGLRWQDLCVQDEAESTIWIEQLKTWTQHNRDRLTGREAVVLPLCFTHGDFSPRNWMIDPGGSEDLGFALIDFGRSGIRPGFTELDHLWGTDAALLAALSDGWGKPVRFEDFPAHEQDGFLTYKTNSLMSGLEWALRNQERALYRDFLSQIPQLIALG